MNNNLQSPSRMEWRDIVSTQNPYSMTRRNKHRGRIPAGTGEPPSFGDTPETVRFLCADMAHNDILPFLTEATSCF